jgi:undecaprenyl-phosphate 4-deoxy-4-formamido-L-arabinose transferase
MRSDRLLTFVIPVYRSASCLAATVTELVAFCESRARFEIVLVNDASPDGVQEIIDRLCAADSRVRAIALGANAGQHRATLQGFAEARGDIVITIDDDGQNPPSAAMAVAEALEREDLDAVYGTFEARGQAPARRLVTAVNRWVSTRTLPNPRSIPLTNVRAVRGDLARQLGVTAPAYPYLEALIFRMTSRIGDVPVEHRPRASGTSGYTPVKLMGMALSHVTSLTVLPLRLAVAGSFGISALGFLVGAAATVRALASGGAPLGWLSLFCAVTFLFSVLFAFLGIVSAYVGRMYVATNERGLVWVRSRTPPA